MRLFSLPTALLALLASGAVAQLALDTSSEQSIKRTAKSIASSLVKIYTDFLNTPGVGIPGLLPAPYYWWEAGGMFGVLLSYWHTTGDDSYNDLISDAMQFQVGDNEAFMPQNQTKSLGNDDQAFWGFAAMTAAEYKFPNPSPEKPQWLALAQAVWNSQQLRWDTQTCAGGLHWQIYSFNNGYDYKHTPSNAAFVNLGARLYAYTGNETYAEWTVKVWDWINDMGLIGGPLQWTIFDGVTERDNCTTIEHIQWTYNFGMMMSASAVMWNATGDELWRTRAAGIWNASQVFWNQDMVLHEAACEAVKQCGDCYTCNNDQMSFKAYFIRWVATSTQWAPWLYDMVQPYFVATAQAVAQSCQQGDPGANCGQRWDTGSFYNTTGPGQQMSALEAINALLIDQAVGPVTAKTGGTSKGDPTAGTEGDDGVIGTPPPVSPITTADKVGAGIVTAVLMIIMLGTTYWMII